MSVNATHPNNREGKSVVELFSDLSQGISKMFRQEVELAKAEITTKARKKIRDVAFIIAGGFVIFAGFLFLLVAAVAALGMILPVWLASLTAGIIVCGLTYSFIPKGLSDLKRGGLKPEKAIEEIKESGKWAKEQI